MERIQSHKFASFVLLERIRSSSSAAAGAGVVIVVGWCRLC